MKHIWTSKMVAKCHEGKYSALFILLYGLFIANTAQASFSDNRYNQLGENFQFTFLPSFQLFFSYYYTSLCLFLFHFSISIFIPISSSPRTINDSFCSLSSPHISSSFSSLFILLSILHSFTRLHAHNTSLHFPHYFPPLVLYSVWFQFTLCFMLCYFLLLNVECVFHNYGFEVMKLEID